MMIQNIKFEQTGTDTPCYLEQFISKGVVTPLKRAMHTLQAWVGRGEGMLIQMGDLI